MKAKWINALIACLFLAACTSPTPSEGQIQTAIAETQAALPPTATTTATHTATPSATVTQTAIVTPSLTPTLIPTATSMPTATITTTVTTIPEDKATLAISPTPRGEEISWDEAKSHTGEYVTVCGPVEGAHYAQESNGKPTFLNMGADYPDEERVSVLIWDNYRYNFPFEPELHYLGKWVCVYGFIYSYRGISTLEVYDPAQILSD